MKLLGVEQSFLSYSRLHKSRQDTRKRIQMGTYKNTWTFLGRTLVDDGLLHTVMRVLRGFSSTPLRCLWSGWGEESCEIGTSGAVEMGALSVLPLWVTRRCSVWDSASDR